MHGGLILAFAEDAPVCIFDGIAQANTHCEAMDVEEGVFTFLNEEGGVLTPVFCLAPSKSSFFGIKIIGSGIFTLSPTSARRDDLIHDLVCGEITIDKTPANIQSLDDLKNAAPLLFQAAAS